MCDFSFIRALQYLVYGSDLARGTFEGITPGICAQRRMALSRGESSCDVFAPILERSQRYTTVVNSVNAPEGWRPIGPKPVSVPGSNRRATSAPPQAMPSESASSPSNIAAPRGSVALASAPENSRTSFASLEVGQLAEVSSSLVPDASGASFASLQVGQLAEVSSSSAEPQALQPFRFFRWPGESVSSSTTTPSRLVTLTPALSGIPGQLSLVLDPLLLLLTWLFRLITQLGIPVTMILGSIQNRCHFLLPLLMYKMSGPI